MKGNSPFSPKYKMLKIARSLLIPYFVFSVLMAIPKAVAHHQTHQLGIIFKDILTGNASWFITALIISEVFFIAIMSITKGRTLWMVLLSVITLVVAALFGNQNSAYCNPYNIWHINEAMLGCFCMLLGFLYHLYEEKIDCLNRIPVIIVLACCWLAIKAVIISKGMQTVFGPVIVSSFPLFTIDLLLSVVLLTSIFKRLPSISMIEWTGSHCIVYYFICGGVPLLVGFFLNYIGFPYQGHLSMLIAYPLVYALATAIVYVIYRYFSFLTPS